MNDKPKENVSTYDPKQVQQELTQKVIKYCEEIGAEVHARVDFGVNPDGTIKVIPTPFVIEAKNEEPKDNAPGDSADQAGQPSPKAKQ